jgi:hypothetical protein
VKGRKTRYMTAAVPFAGSSTVTMVPSAVAQAIVMLPPWASIRHVRQRRIAPEQLRGARHEFANICRGRLGLRRRQAVSSLAQPLRSKATTRGLN